jgi:hypothetical protein
MDQYKNKYLKYKNKYIELKNIIGGTKDAKRMRGKYFTKDYPNGVVVTSLDDFSDVIDELTKSGIFDITRPTIVFDYHGVIDYLDHNIDLGVNAICLSYITEKSSNLEQTTNDIKAKIASNQIVLGITTYNDCFKGHIIAALKLNYEGVEFIDDNARNIRSVNVNKSCSNVISTQFIHRDGRNKESSQMELIDLINEIKKKYGFGPIIYTPTTESVSESISDSATKIVDNTEEQIKLEKPFIPEIITSPFVKKLIIPENIEQIKTDLFTKFINFLNDLLKRGKITNEIKEKYTQFYTENIIYFVNQFMYLTGVTEVSNSKYEKQSLEFFKWITHQNSAHTNIKRNLLFNPQVHI